MVVSIGLDGKSLSQIFGRTNLIELVGNGLKEAVLLLLLVTMPMSMSMMTMMTVMG